MRKEIENPSATSEAVAAVAVSHLLHPASHFRHPCDVLSATHLGKAEKRAILASWASDQFAVESIPTLRQYPGAERTVTYGEVLSALKALDGETEGEPRGSHSTNASARRLHSRFFLPMRRRHRMARSRA